MDNLLGLKNASEQDISAILDNAFELKNSVLLGNKKSDILSGKSVLTLFFENSTRTRLSFELAAKYLSATQAHIAAQGSSVSKGESLIDTVKTLDRMKPDVIIIRHSSSGVPELITKYTNAAVVNAGDGMNEHPTQALLDIMTVQELKGSLKGLKIAMVGDVKYSRVARSNIYGMKKLGAEVAVAAPSTLMPSEIEQLGVKAYNDVERAIEGADVVMGLRIQLERQKKGLFPTIREYSRIFGIDSCRMKLAKPDAILMHPGPVNRGVEISAEAADGEQSVICDQVTNGVAVRMAVLNLLTNGGKTNELAY